MAIVLAKYRGDQRWSRNRELQAEVFRHLVNEVSSFLSPDGGALEVETQARRARTYTNALQKVGLCDEERCVTTLGGALIEGEFELDSFEQGALLRPENATMLRGLLSFRLSSGSKTLFPFLLLLRAMQECGGKLSLDEFKWVLLVAPTSPNFSASYVTTGLKQVREDDGIEASLLREMPELTSLAEIFYETGEEVEGLFPNGKGSTYVARYWEFVRAIQRFHANPSEDSALALLDSMSTNTVKNAFGTVGNFPSKSQLRKIGYRQFYDAITFPGFQNSTPRGLREALVRNFTLGKKLALIDEYSDNNRRLASSTGLFSVANQQVEVKDLFAREYLATLPPIQFEFDSSSDNMHRPFEGFDCIFGAEHVTETFNHLKREFGVDTEAEVRNYLKEQRRSRFYESVSTNFPKDWVHQLLHQISDSYPSPELERTVRRAFATEPTVPTAYEYLVGLSAYYQIGPKTDPLQLFGMALDADFLPLSPAPGGRGDIEVITDDVALLIEVTLMNPANQRRNEMEPVLRHASNFQAEFGNRLTARTLFVANQIDHNVNTVLRFARLMPLHPTIGSGTQVVNPIIECRTTDEWLNIVLRDPTMEEFLKEEFGSRNDDVRELYRQLYGPDEFVINTSIEGPQAFR